MLAVALVYVLLMTQWRLNDHVVEHGATVTSVSQLAAISSSDTPTSDEGAGCLLCLEHQAHGIALTSAFTLLLGLMVSVLMAKALPYNTPYLSPERARQRAPPAFS